MKLRKAWFRRGLHGEFATYCPFCGKLAEYGTPKKPTSKKAKAMN